MGSSTEHSAWHPTANPWDLERVPGGSSGGSAAALAGQQCLASLGSDTGGSIRQPASFCGVVGLKPTYGRVSRNGLIAFASSLDQIGPFTRSVEDAAMLLQAIAGPDPLDATCYDVQPPDFSARLEDGLDGLRIAAPQEFFGDGMDDDVAVAVEAALNLLAANGAVVDRSPTMPTIPMALPVYYVLAPSECSANLARFDGVKYGYGARGGESMWADMESTRQHGFGREVKRRILLGAYALSAGYYDAYYLQAQKVRTLIRREFDRVFEDHDVIVAPTAPTVAFKQGAISDPYQMYLNDIFTIPANIAGLPCDLGRRPDSAKVACPSVYSSSATDWTNPPSYGPRTPTNGLRVGRPSPPPVGTVLCTSTFRSARVSAMRESLDGETNSDHAPECWYMVNR